METFENLRQLISINSKTQNELGEHNIQGVNAAGECVKKLVSDLPIKWNSRTHPEAPDFLIGESEEMNTNEPVIILSGHLDTVFASHDVEEKETEDKIFGSGAQDMKAGLIVIVEVLRNLHKVNKLKNIILCLSPEEETATLHYRNILEEVAKRGDYVLVFESTLDSLPNAKLNDRSIVKSRRGFQQFDLNIYGPGGHSGVIFKKEERKNTILLAAEMIQKLESLADYKKQTTLNTGFIHGGEAINVLAPHTKLSFEVRFKEIEELERVRKSLFELVENYNLDTDYKLELSDNRFFPPFFVKDEIFINICKEVADNLKVGLYIEERAGGGEASLFQHFNPKAHILDGFGVRGEGQHTKNEWVYKESILSTIDYVYEVVKRLIS